jgi:hypothetical protein
MWGSPKDRRAGTRQLGAQLLPNHHSFIGTGETPADAPVEAVVTICAQQKRHKPRPEATPAALQSATLIDLAAQWTRVVKDLSPASLAADLYGGRAFGLARKAAKDADSRFYVISAGLGLVDGQTFAPAYGLTVSPNASESIQAKAVGTFATAHWFEEMMAGPLSTDWTHIFERGSGEVLIALTRPYAEMVGLSLAKLPQQHRNRLRLFGANLSSALPASLHSALAPYDDRLDTIFPGTRSDFAQRAMVHYVEHVALPGADRAAAYKCVLEALADVEMPARLVRRGANDGDLLALIKTRLSPTASASRLLRQLRDDDGIACEQGRFARLFRQAQAGEALQ